MTWNRTKWNQFVADSTVVPPTDAAAKKAAEEAKDAASRHEENIDLEALGIQRVKDMLRDLAAETPGSKGADGSAGATTYGALRPLVVDQWSGTGIHETSYTFATGELDGYRDILIVKNYAIGDQIEIIWSLPGADNIFMTTAPCDGYYEYWIMQHRVFKLGVPYVGEVGANVLRIGAGYDAVVTYVLDGGGPASVVNDWMAVGGILTVKLTTTAPGNERVIIGVLSSPLVVNS